MADLSIRQILDQISRGQIRIPAFQRGFVWEADRVAYLMDSIYKEYPFGSLLFWRTKEKLKADRKLGPFQLPDPQADYPIDYVLDGQQRITSIFGVFQTEMPTPSVDGNWLPIYFDLEAASSAQDSQFVALSPDKVDPARHFPLATLFNTVAYRRANQNRPDHVIEKIDRMQEIFKEVKIPVQTSSTDNKATVAIIFERVNRQGVDLDTLQLLSAWTWSEEFQLQDQFKDLAEELSPFGFADIGEDSNLLLRCCSAVLKHDASPQALMEINGAEVRENFERVSNGIKYAVDFLRKNVKAEKLDNLPFATLLVPLSVFFAVEGNREASYTDQQRTQILNWFWRSSFSKRYSSAVLRNLNNDIEEMVKLRDGKTSNLGNFDADIDARFFVLNTFGFNNLNTKTFVLMLANNNPRSFKSGQPVDLAQTLKAANRTEFHHLMPKAYLKTSTGRSFNESVLANFAFLSRADNRTIGGDKPSVYRKKMASNVDEVLESAIVPKSLFADNYNVFIKERAKALNKQAHLLCGLTYSAKSDIWLDFFTSAQILNLPSIISSKISGLNSPEVVVTQEEIEKSKED